MIRYIFIASAIGVSCLLFALILSLPTPQHALTKHVGNDVKRQDASSKLQASTHNNVIFTNVTIFDGVDVTPNQTLVVTNGEISSITPMHETSKSISVTSAQDYIKVDGTGLTLIPGIIDAHTHTYGNGLSDALRFGVTTHLDMFGTEETLAQTRAAREALSRSTKTDLYSAGTLATVASGHGTQFGLTIDTIDSFEEIASWVAGRKQAGADYIKLVYMPYLQYKPSLTRELAKEIISQSHQQGMQVLAHISTHQAAQDMVEDGIDGLVHIFADKLASDELVALAALNEVFIIPTLAVIAAADGQNLSQALISNLNIEPYLSAQQTATLTTTFGTQIPGFDFDLAQQNVYRFYEAGVTILAGSDAPNPGTAYGLSALHETTLLAEAGLPLKQALAAATSHPARVFSLTGRGVIAKGARADMVLLSGDPAADIDALYSIKAVYKNGFSITREIDVQGSTDNIGSAFSNPVLGDFTKDTASADGLNTINDFIWTSSDDGMAGGNSTASIKVVNMAGVNNDSKNGVLKVTAFVNTAFAYPWAGAAVGDFRPPVEGVDTSNYTHISFEAKGTPGIYRVMGFDANAAGIPPLQSFELSEEWKTVTLSLSAFSGLNLKVVSGLAFVAGPQRGEFIFYLDNIRIE